MSSGVVIGRAQVLDAVERYVPERMIPADAVEAEVERLWQAIGAALDELTELRNKTEEELGSDPAKILDFHIGVLQDPTLVTPMQERITEGLVNAERAVAERFDQLAKQFRGMGSEVLRQKANDIIDLDRRILGKLLGQSVDKLIDVDEPVALVAHELTPSQAAAVSLVSQWFFHTNLRWCTVCSGVSIGSSHRTVGKGVFLKNNEKVGKGVFRGERVFFVGFS